MKARSGIWFLLLLILAGCRDNQLPPFNGSRFEFVEWPKDAPVGGGTSTCYGLFDDEVVYVVWSDLPQGWAGGCDSGRDNKRKYATHKVGQAETDGRKVNFEFQMEHTASGRKGSITFGGSQHDLANATVFLISTKGGQARVKAIKCDLASMKPSEESLVALAKREPEIAAFLANPAR